MARNVRISVIGVQPPDAPPHSQGQDLVDTMVDFWRGKIDQVVPNQPDLIVMPEMSDRFINHSRSERMAYYAARGEQVLDFYRDLAKRHRCYIVYPTARPAENSTWRNAAYLIGRDGEVVGVYHKNHLVVTETSSSQILCGRDAPTFECDFGRVAIAICFDLNFEELRLKYAAERPDLIVFPSNYHGGIMQSYWAYSCQAHFVGAMGDRGLPSSVMSPVGQILATTTNYFNHVTTTVNLDCCVVHLDFNWEKLRALKAKYGSQVEVLDPGLLGVVLITNHLLDRKVQDLVKEFDIEVLNDYFERSIAHRHNECNMEPLNEVEVSRV
jgi:hypothetical protein